MPPHHTWSERLERIPQAYSTAFLVCAAFLVYAGSIPAGYVFDDEFAILGNPVVQGQVPLWEAFLRDFWGRSPHSPDAIGTYRPLPLLLLGIEWRLSHGAAWAMHLGNVLWHCGAIACFVLAFAPLAGRRLALAAAALASVMSAPAEAVQAIVGRADLMCTVFVLLTLYFHRRSGAGATFAAAAFLGLALGSKESAVAILPVLWGLDRLIRPDSGRKPTRFLVYGSVLVVYVLLRAQAVGATFEPRIDPQSNPLILAAPLERFLGAGRIFLERYIAGIIDPGRRLYECSAMACGPATPDDVLAWAGVALALCLVLLPVLLWRRAPLVAAGVFWFICFFLPVSNFLVLSPSLYGERLLYLPMLGGALATTTLAEALARRLARPALAWGLVATAGLANLAALQLRHWDWRTDAALYVSAIEHVDTSAKVHKNLAVVLSQEEDWPAAEYHARRALELWPDNVTTRPILGAALAMQGRAGEAEAEFRQALEAAPRGSVVCPFAIFLARQKRFTEALTLMHAHAGATANAPECHGLAEKLSSAVGTAR
ncbi:tetratricopeptide repeat protein [Comamonas sp. JC664]|uniref:tetratricopeptide repeat protein n=1 Tax=Comamonas sp. JC664 TaxID=2801917 RepID=UPI0017499FCC|nr:tetratricopeptide repeat protein [Comamonas sp. JC664]MBL0695972.1 tetratricopeptide repeat protein [Comamonas sp. JC664]GHG64542.1 hypothetical protein GCM10012319_05020 [Comamonas sp. KCTC 72670]